MSTEIDLSEYKTANDVAKLFNVTGTRIRQLCAAGRFKGAVKFGTAWLIPASAIASFEWQRPRPANSRAAMYDKDKLSIPPKEWRGMGEK